ncbi:uncharacterized protein FFMR_15780 [Fusarium fujikuroi]|nr:uncharacterized protein FFMR_15780 [Fusarium fujikuroi]
MAYAINIKENKAGPLSIQNNIAILPESPEEVRNTTRRDLLARIGPPVRKPTISPGTCRWILSDPQFEAWHESSSQHILWITGRAGKGKSHLATFITQSLTHKPRSQYPPLVLQVSCDNSDIRRSTSLSVHLNILHQILNFPRCDKTLQDTAAAILRDPHTRFDSNLPREDLWDLIKDFVNRPLRITESVDSDYRIYLVLDGLDECDPESIEDLCTKLQQICADESRERGPFFKIVVLSRPLGHMQHLQTWINLDDDQQYGQRISTEIGLFIEDQMQPVLGSRKSALKVLKTILSERSHGTFLWVSLALNILKSRRTDLEDILTGGRRDLLDAILPVGLQSMYNRMLLEALGGKYDGQHNPDPESCAKIIRYICTAYRPLTQAELQTAVGIPHISTVIGYCRHVLSQSSIGIGPAPDGADGISRDDSNERSIQLLHLSLKDYLLQAPNFQVPASLGLIAWPLLSRTVNMLRIATYRRWYLDQIGFAAIAVLLSLHLHIKTCPVFGTVLLSVGALCAFELHSLWKQKRSCILELLLAAFEALLCRCVHAVFAISESKCHNELLFRSLEVLMDEKLGLKEEKKCNLSRPGALSAKRPQSIDAELDPFGKYASCFWVEHLYSLCTPAYGGVRRIPYEGLLLQFMENYFLHWLRNLSQQDKIRDCVGTMRKIVRVIEKRQTKNKQLDLLLKDAERFMTRFAQMIEDAPFQAYGSALAFCPTNSILRSLFWKQVLPIAKNIKTSQNDWSPLLQTLSCDKLESIASVAISHDGKIVASASDHTVRLWDIETGRLTKVLTSHGAHLRSVAFLRCGNVVACARKSYFSGDVMGWDTSTGESIGSFNTNVEPYHLTCSPWSDTIAVQGPGAPIEIWHFDKGDSGRRYLEHKIPDVDTQSMAFTSNGHIIVDGYREVKVWNIATHQLVYTATKPQGDPLKRRARIDSLALQLLDGDSSAELWDPATNTLCQRVIKAGACTDEVALSPNGKIYAIASDTSSSQIELWSSKGIPWSEKPHVDNRDMYEFMLVSPDGSILATRTEKEGLRLMSLENGALVPLAGPILDSFPSRLVFSPCGNLLAYEPAFSSGPREIFVWSLKDKKETHCLGVRKSCRISSMIFSPNGQMLAFDDEDGVALWNLDTGAHRILAGGFEDGHLLAFSGNSHFIAFPAADNTIDVWDCTTFGFIMRLQGHTDYLTAITLSFNGQQVASSSNDNTFRVWNTRNEMSEESTIEATQKDSMTLSEENMRDLTFLQDDNLLISLNHNHELWVWNLRDRAVRYNRAY